MSLIAQSTVDYVKRLANARRRRARGFATRFRRESHAVGVTEATRSGFSYYRLYNNLCSVPARIGGRLYERLALRAPVGGVNPSQELI